MMVLTKASREKDIAGILSRPTGGESCARTVSSSSPGPSGLLRGFSLIEVLMSIFILAIGIISITALFPAGIAQQRHAIDDMMGPIVANNAMTVLRSKLRPEDFGTDEGIFSPDQLRTLLGDWEWRRPVFFLDEATITVTRNHVITNAPISYTSDVLPGSISIFKKYSETTDWDRPRIPWTVDVNGNVPERIFTQKERFYPLTSGRERPQFVWDCMFRRFQGRILVAIFVYRVTSPGGGGVPYSVAGETGESPPLPIKFSFNSADAWNAKMGSNITDLLNIIPNTNIGDDVYDPVLNNVDVAWQLPGQRILDQNNIVHHVLAGRETQSDGPLELARPVAPVLGNPFDTDQGNLVTESPFYYFGEPNRTIGTAMYGMVQVGVVTRIWYLPEYMDITVNGITTTYTITPVYITVREL